MRKIKAYAYYGFVGAKRDEIIEIDDDATDEEIEELIWEWANDYVYTDWEEMKER